ncbi:uncharacterized protein LOC123529635 [Mercenaria mercenaria]|uniref:uncharacterized protein LOC123529635 n=1 Tax=Mercenaria mercenaria TaxID=6596 RepID=UPI00234E6D68|nr:uncharacterized protein LOC123529635 [Mercenaria mercenaria]
MSNKPKVADPTELKWPVVDSEKEKTVLEVLEKVFAKYKSCLRTIKKPPKWKKKAEGDKEDCLSEEEESLRKQFKSWFVVGAQTVMRNLERDKLSAVLLWSEMQPAVLRKALLHLVSQHGCPAICVSDLLSSIQKSWPGLTSAAVLGVLRMEEPNDFKELVESIRTNAPHVTDPSVTEDKLLIQKVPVIEPDQSKDKPKADAKTEQFKSDTSNETCNKHLCRPVVDATKYYIYKSETDKSKSFSGQSFIAFDEGPQCKTIETVKGIRVKNERRVRKNPVTFGIQPSLLGTDTDKVERNKSEAASKETDHSKGDFERNVGSMKRKATDSETGMYSEYKGINVKRFQKNMQKKKKIKNKKKK